MERERCGWLCRARRTSVLKVSLRCATLILAVLLPRVGAAGTDWKTYAGSMCQAGHRKELIDYDAFGGICNTSQEQNVVIHCPVVRDFSISRFPILVRHAGRSGNVDVTLQCKLRRMKREAANSGASMQDLVVDLVAIPSGQATTIQFRETDLTDFPNLPTNNWGGLVLTCDLPPSNFRFNGQQVQSCLYNYSIEEWDGNP